MSADQESLENLEKLQDSTCSPLHIAKNTYYHPHTSDFQGFYRPQQAIRHQNVN